MGLKTQTKTGALGARPKNYLGDHDPKTRTKTSGVKNNPLASTSSEITLDEEGNNAAILRVIEEVHQRPACHLGARDDNPPFPVYLASQDVK